MKINSSSVAFAAIAILISAAGIAVALKLGQLVIGLLIFPGIPLILLWFIYHMFLRRLLRLRRIRNARERREFREAIMRGHDDQQ